MVAQYGKNHQKSTIFFSFGHPPELRLWRTGMLFLTKSKSQQSNVHYQWTYRCLLCGRFWVQRPCKCYLHYGVLRSNTLQNLNRRTWAFLKSWVPTCIQLSLKTISPNLAKMVLFSSHNSPALKPNALVGQFLDLLNFPASIGSCNANCCSFRTKFSCLALKTSWKDKKITFSNRLSKVR